MPQCSLLNTHICAVLPGYYKPCCQYVVYDDIYKDVLLSEMSHKEYTQTPQFQRIKKDMETGWHKGCEKCFLDETQNGLTSLRQLANNRYSNSNQIQFVEISLSNNCNLSCKMCNPWASSTWSDLHKKNPAIQKYFNNLEIDISIDKIFRDIDFSSVEKIKYLGGEPFITPQTRTLFDFLEENNSIGNIILQTNTNCTFYPKKLISYLLKFKKVIIGLSVDGFDKSCEYSRTGSRWENICNVIEQWYDLYKNNQNIEIYFSTTINALTVHDFQKISSYSEEKNLNIYPYVLHNPKMLKLEALPPEYLKTIKDSYNSKFLQNVVYDSRLFEKLKEFIKSTDTAQKIKIKDYIPELAKYLT